MTTPWWRTLGLLLLLPVLLLAGCTPAYQGTPSEETYPGTISPSWYGDNPQMEQWYTAPYWRPDAD
jgi:hypothetical protein